MGVARAGPANLGFRIWVPGDNRVEGETSGKVPLGLLLVLLNKPSSLLGKHLLDVGCRERSDRYLLIE